MSKYTNKSNKGIMDDLMNTVVISGFETGDILPDPAIYQYYKFLQNRIIHINEAISEECYKYTNQIAQWNLEDKINNIPVEDRKPITVLISSVGGDVDVGMGLCRAILCSKTPVITVNWGYCYSMASLIYLAGSKRYTLKGARYLLHEGTAGFMGGTSQVISQAENLKKVEEIVKAYVLERTKIDTKLYSKKQKTEWYVESEDQITLGITDKIIDSLDEIF